MSGGNEAAAQDMEAWRRDASKAQSEEAQAHYDEAVAAARRAKAEREGLPASIEQTQSSAATPPPAPEAPVAPQPGPSRFTQDVNDLARLNPIAAAAQDVMKPKPAAPPVSYADPKFLPSAPPAPPPPAPAPEAAPQGAPLPPPPQGGGSPGILVPGGMQPFSEKREVKEGIPVAPEIQQAYGQAEGLKQRAANVEHEAIVGLQPQIEAMERQKLAAVDRARVEHQVLADERNEVVQDRMQQIEQLNKAAQGKPEDLWNSGTAFARVIGTLLSAVGFVTAAKGGRGAALGMGAMAAGSILNGLVNEDINSKREARKGAADQAKRETDLLHLHEQNFKDRDQAIDATKLAYYDNILQNMEALKAGPYAQQINEAKFLQLQGNLLNERAQLAERIQTKETAQIQGESVAHMTKPQLLGGGGGAPRKEPGNIVTFNGTSYAMPNEKQQNEAIAKIQSRQQLIRVGNDIQQLRAEAMTIDPVKDWAKYDAVLARLNEAEQTKLNLISVAEGQGVIREGEYKRAQETTGYATTGLGRAERVGAKRLADMHFAAGNAVNQQQIERWTKELQQVPAEAGGKIVREGYQRNPQTGSLEPVADYTGQNTAPQPGLAPAGSKAMDPHVRLPTMPRPAAETTPRAPEVPYRAPPAKGHGGKKKDE